MLSAEGDEPAALFYVGKRLYFYPEHDFGGADCEVNVTLV